MELALSPEDAAFRDEVRAFIKDNYPAEMRVANPETDLSKEQMLLWHRILHKKGWIALKNLNLNMNALMAIAVTGGMAIGHWPEAAMVMFLFALAEVIEAKSLDRARNAIRGLMDLAPETATVRPSPRP